MYCQENEHFSPDGSDEYARSELQQMTLESLLILGMLYIEGLTRSCLRKTIGSHCNVDFSLNSYIIQNIAFIWHLTVWCHAFRAVIIFNLVFGIPILLLETNMVA